MTAKELREKYLNFFESKGHKIISSASLVPEHDPTVLFTTAGMHPLVPYLLGQEHPQGKRLTNVQKCLRTDDIDDVGDPWHNTFFEMLGNWSLGEYWKEEAISWSFEFLTKELGLDPNRISVTVFGGDQAILGVTADEQSIAIWKKLGIPDERIYRLGKNDNWWGPVGETGPCGPDTEMFYDTGKAEHGKICRPGESCGKYTEIWNDVFMEYNRTKDGKYEKLTQKNVDTGMGLERMLAVLQGRDSVYETELFSRVIEQLKTISENYQETSARVIADHLRSATFLLAEKVVPSNVERGYVLRRLLRRAIRHGRLLGINSNFAGKIAEEFIAIYKEQYPELIENAELIFSEIAKEEEKFQKVIGDGLRKSQKLFETKKPIDHSKFNQMMQVNDKKEIFREYYRTKTPEVIEKFKVDLSREELEKATINGKEAFNLYQSYGFPTELIIELAQAENLVVDMEALEKEVESHRQVSRAGMEKKFAGGLGDHSEITVRGHTATHLLHQALRDVLGDSVHQTGSNITPERIRFDFSYSEKLTPEQINKVEDIVNSKIQSDLQVKKELMSQEEADKKGAIGLFKDKYGDKVSIYEIGDYSTEYCGGPHVEHTSQVGEFKIIKEESISAGQRRIKAVLE